MNTKKVAISMPSYLYEELRLMLRPGELSGFIAEATEEKILDVKLAPNDPIKAFFDLRKKAPKLTDKQIMASIRKGRM